MISEQFSTLDDLVILGKAMDFVDGGVARRFCIGIEDMKTRKGISYEAGEGGKLIDHIKQLKTESLIIIVAAYPPPKAITQELLGNIGIGAVTEEIGLLYFDPNEADPIYAIEVQEQMLQGDGVVAENPFTLLNQLIEPLERD